MECQDSGIQKLWIPSNNWDISDIPVDYWFQELFMGISGMSYPSGAGDTVHSLVQIILLTQQIIDFF